MADDREERIRKRAYEMWERDGFPEGQHDAHWQEAEAEIDAEIRSEGSAGSVSGGPDQPGATGGDDAAPAKPKKTRAPRKAATSKSAAATPAKATKTGPRSTTAREPRARKSAKPEGED